MKIILYILAGLVATAIVYGIVHQQRDCAARGGVLVKGQFSYVCVAAARSAP